MSTIRMVIADDHAVVREGIKAILQRQPDMLVVAEAGDGQETVAAVVLHRPDVLLIDLTMPSSGGLDAIGRVRVVSPATRMLVLSMHVAPEYVRLALRRGGHGYLSKGTGLNDLVRAVRVVANGERFLDAKAAAAIAADEVSPCAAGDDLDRLTARERSVLQLVAEGHTNRAIADRLGVSPKTVDVHRTNLMRKLDLHSAQAITRYALRRGLISAE